MFDKRRLMSLHRQVALVLAPLVALQVLTGALLLESNTLSQWLDPGAFTRVSQGARLSMYELFVRASSALPGHRITRLSVPADRQGAAFITLSDGTFATIDPGSGHLLSCGGLARYPFEAARQLHEMLLMPSWGVLAILLIGAGLAGICASGLWFWWPGRGRALKSIKVRKGLSAKLALRQYHRTLGVLAAPVLLFSACTGVLLAGASLDWSTPGRGHSDITPPPAGKTAISERIAQTETAARKAFPDSGLRELRIGADDTIELRLPAPTRSLRAVDIVRLGPAANAAPRTIPAATNPALWMTLLPIHAGDVGGEGTRLLLFLACGAALFLAFSGPIAWWQRIRTTAKGGRKQGPSRR